MTIKGLRCFAAAAEQLNFSRAAEILRITQSALSQQILALEKELGAALFLRSYQKVYLTPAGAALLEKTRGILGDIASLPDIVSRAADEDMPKSSSLSIWIDSGIPEMMLGTFITGMSAFQQQYPDISVSFDTVLFHDYKDVLFSHNADLCLMALMDGELVPPSFMSQPVAVEPMLLAYRGEDILSTKEMLASYELILVDGAERWDMALLGFLKANNLHPRMRKVTGGPAVFMNLQRNHTMSFMPRAFFDSIAMDGLHNRYLGIPGDKAISSLIWNKENMNPNLQMLVKSCGSCRSR